MKPPLQCDVAVVGAGPAGATAAYLLAGRGLHVRLFDKHRFPRSKLCAGLLTWKTIDLLERVFGLNLDALQQQGLVVHACREYRIYYSEHEIARGCLDFPFHFVDRTRYDWHWLQMAAAAGARLETGMAVTQADAGRGELVLADGHLVRAHLIIGADGVWSRVRKAFHGGGGSEKRWRAGLAATLEGHRPCSPGENAPSFAALHFGGAAWGYGWSFPGAELQTVGAAMLAREKGALRQAFNHCLRSHGIVPSQLGACRSYPLPYGNFLHAPARQKALLIGDAAGLADPLLGEGIYYAHRSAQAAAQAILDAAGKWEQAAPAYCRALRRDVISELRWLKFFRNLLFFGGRSRRYRGLKLFCRLFPKRLEAAVQGKRPFSKLFLPGGKPL